MKNLFLVSLFILISLCLAYLVQSSGFLHGDVLYLSYVTQLLLQGGTYGKDFFETNPPMILFLSVIPLTLSKLTAIDLATIFRIYVLTLVFFSSVTSYFLLNKIIAEKFVLNFFMAVLLFALLFLPANQFGQREHLFFILTLPYFFAAVCALQHIHINRLLAITIGVMAGLGFALKPYFLIPLILVELYVIVHTRRLLGWVRIETGAILTVLAAYLVIIYINYPSYVDIMLPLINQFYLAGIKEPWFYILTENLILFCLIAISAYWVLRQMTRYPVLSTVLMLATLGTTLAILVTRATWFYHTIPAVAFSCLLLSLLLAEFSHSFSKSGWVIVMILSGLLFYIPIDNTISLSYLWAKESHVGANKKLIDYLQQANGEHSVMCFSANTTTDCFPLVEKTQSHYASRFPFFWWMRSVYSAAHAPQPATLSLANNVLINAVAEDFQQQKPRWVVINIESSGYIFGKDFSYSAFFSANKNFRLAWKPYHYLTTIDHYQIYERAAS